MPIYVSEAAVDKLETIFAMQKSLNDDIVRLRALEGIPDEEWIRKNVLAMVSELGELLDEVNFKWWKNEKPVNEAAVREELVDILHFFISMCLKAGMDANDLFEGYIAKNKENFDRQYGRSTKPGYAAGKDA